MREEAAQPVSIGSRAEDSGVILTQRRPILARWARLARSKPLGAVSLAVVLIIAAFAAFAPLFSTHDPQSQDLFNRIGPLGSQHWFGTDDLGRDVYSRLVYGARVSLAVGFLTVVGSSFVGLAVGGVSAFYGRWIDLGIQRFVDIFMAFPVIVFILLLITALGQGLTNVVLAIAIVQTPAAIRVVRSVVLAAREEVYVQAARSVGCSDVRLMIRHILPNTFAPLITLATASMGVAIVAEASLSFLGLGIPPPTPTWGGMLGSSLIYQERAPWLAIFPGAAIGLTVMAFNLLGDTLRDLLDPRLRGTS